MHDNYTKYVRWFCTPLTERNPKTLEELMSVLSISSSDLIEFTERPSFYEDLKREARNWGYSKLPELIHLAYKTAKDGGKPIAIKIFKELLEEEKGGGGNINIINISPNSTQYTQIVEREARRLGKVVSEVAPSPVLMEETQ
jgi:hypothetical protein